MGISAVGIIGAGTMGNGIAQACAVAGLNVVMVDVAEAAVAAAVVVEAPADGAYGNLDSVVTGGGFTNQYAPATTASTTTAAASTLANPTHSIHDPRRATSERGGGGRSGKSDTMAP